MMPDEHDHDAAETPPRGGEAAPPHFSSPSQPSPHELARQQQRTILQAVRMSFFVLLFTVGLLSFLQDVDAPENTADDFVIISRQMRWVITLSIPIVLALAAVTTDVLTPRKKVSTISGVVLGILGGLLATIAIGAVLDLMMQAWINQPRVMTELSPIVLTFKVMLGITLCYLGVSTVIQTQDDFRLVIPYVEFSRQIRGPKPLLLDTSALIDARIAEVAATGMLQTPLVIPRFVVLELQTLADSADRMKRLKGRRGLDVIGRLQRGVLDVTIDETPVPGKAVDQMIVELARLMPAILVTTDSALERVARIQGVGVLNLHETAAAFRPALAPGEQIVLRLVKPGEQPGQAVGYLDDGTMVVAENAAGLIGQDAALTVSSTMQTSAGRLVFAKPTQVENAAAAARPARDDDARADGEHEPATATELHADEGHPATRGSTASGEAAGPDAASSGNGETPGEADYPGGNDAAGTDAPQKTGSPPSGPYPPRRSDRRPPTPRNPRRG